MSGVSGYRGIYQVGPSFGPERDLNNQADRFDSSQHSDLQGCVKHAHILRFQSRYNARATPGNQLVKHLIVIYNDRVFVNYFRSKSWKHHLQLTV
jgi:hypothetical protein